MLIFYFQNCQLLFLSSVILWYSLALYFRFADNAQLYKNIDLLTIETLVSGVYYILVQKNDAVRILFLVLQNILWIISKKNVRNWFLKSTIKRYTVSYSHVNNQNFPWNKKCVLYNVLRVGILNTHYCLQLPPISKPPNVAPWPKMLSKSTQENLKPT